MATQSSATQRPATQWRSATPGTKSSSPSSSPTAASSRPAQDLRPAQNSSQPTPITRWQPFADQSPAKPPVAPITHYDSQVQAAAWEEVSGDAAHSIITRRESALTDASERLGAPAESSSDPFERSSDPFDRPIVESEGGAATPLGDSFVEDDSTAVDPFDVDLPEYEAADEPAEQSSEEQPSDNQPAAPNEQLRDSFEDAFKEPTPESINEELEEELPAGQPDAESIIRESQESLDKELMRDKLEQTAPDAFNEPGSFDEPDGEQPADELENEEDTTQFGRRAGSRFIEPHSDENIANEAEQEQRRQSLAKERVQNDKDCRQELADIRRNTIDKVSLSIRVEGEAGQDYPLECGHSDELFAGRTWPEITYMWKASGLCHKPLYFEQVQLERYGHSWGPLLQPVMSGVHFFGSAAMLPYSMGIRTPNECVYTLGYYRPGSCAPYMIDPIPFTWRAAFFQGMTIGTAVVVFP